MSTILDGNYMVYHLSGASKSNMLEMPIFKTFVCTWGNLHSLGFCLSCVCVQEINVLVVTFSDLISSVFFFLSTLGTRRWYSDKSLQVISKDALHIRFLPRFLLFWAYSSFCLSRNFEIVTRHACSLWYWYNLEMIIVCKNMR